jgi:hypothetical protein
VYRRPIYIEKNTVYSSISVDKKKRTRRGNIDELFKDFLFATNKQMSGCVIMSIFYSFMTHMIIFCDNLSGIIKYSSCKGNESWKVRRKGI